MVNEWSLKLDIKKAVSQLIPTFTDGDTTLLKMEIYDNDVPLNLATEGVDNGVFNIKLPNNTIIGGIVTINGNIVEYTFGSEMANIGEVYCKLMLYDVDTVTRISTVPFKVLFDSNWVATDPSNPSQDIATTMIQVVADLEDRIDAIEAGIETPHNHDNKAVLDLLSYTGVETGIDLIAIEDNAIAITDKADMVHTHIGADITDLSTYLATKADTIHTHVMADVTDLQGALDLKSDTTHTHDTLYADKTATEAHINDVTTNPHAVTATLVGLGNVDNTADLDKPISTATQTEIDTKADTIHAHVITDVTDLETDLATITLDIDNIEANLLNMFIGSNARGSQYVTNINNILESGWFYSVDTTNNPVGTSNGYIIHNQFSELNTYALQLFVEYNKDTMFMRRKVNDVWMSWVQTFGTTPAPIIKYLSNTFTTDVAGATSFSIGLPHDVAKDSIHVYINGVKLIKGKHYTANDITITLLNSFSLQLLDDVLIEIFTNSL